MTQITVCSIESALMNEHEVLQIIFPPKTKFANVAHVQFSLDFDIKQIKRQLCTLYNV